MTLEIVIGIILTFISNIAAVVNAHRWDQTTLWVPRHRKVTSWKRPVLVFIASAIAVGSVLVGNQVIQFQWVFLLTGLVSSLCMLGMPWDNTRHRLIKSRAE